VAEAPPVIEDPNDAHRIFANGWRQGSVVPQDLVEALRREEAPDIAIDALLLVASHDCDVTNGKFDVEPDVELLIARPLAQMDGVCTRGKNPRRLHMEIQTPEGPRPFEFEAGGRLRTGRRRLLTQTPKQGYKLRPQDRRVLAQWLAKRYDRAAFPAAFEARWRRVRERLVRLLRRTGHHVEAIFITVGDQELPEGEAYSIVIRGVVSAEHAADQQKSERAQECVDGLAALFDECAGIEVLDSQLVPESEFTLEDLARARRWDWDWLSTEEI
jgi:hypothetical protein